MFFYGQDIGWSQGSMVKSSDISRGILKRIGGSHMEPRGKKSRLHGLVSQQSFIDRSVLRQYHSTSGPIKHELPVAYGHM